MSKRWILGGVVAASVAVAWAPGRAETPKDTVVIAKQIDDIITLDPGECYELSGVEMLTNVYDRLLRYEPEDLSKMVGGVAESWKISDDGKTYIFKIRPNQKFQDGTPVTADDVAFSLQRVAILNKTPGFLITQLGISKDNARDLIKVIDPMTVQMTITENYAPSLVLNLMTSIVASIVEKKLAMEHEENGDLGNGWLKTHSASSGAYKLVSWKPNESVTMEAYPGFRLGPPKEKRVVVRHIPEPATQRLLLEKGDIDVARDLQSDQIAAIAGNKELKVADFPGSDTWYIGLSQFDERLKNPKVQEALRYLVDYQGMVNSFLKGRFIVQQTFLPKGFPASIDYNPFKLDVAKAKQLLAEAGYPDGFNVTLEAQNISPMSDIAQSIQQTMGQAGVKVEIHPAELKQVLTVYRSRKFQMTAINWGPDYLDPHTNADAFVYNPDNGDNSKHKLPAWRAAWDMPELTKETAAAAAELDTEKRMGMYADLQKESTDRGAFIFMLQPVWETAMRANVKGVVQGVTEDLVFYRLITK
jgi:peptide/nickel transport system substrate-binding protein